MEYAGDKYLQLSEKWRRRQLIHKFLGIFRAYPVLWTTAQEADDDFFYKMPNGGQTIFDAASNPWKNVATWTAAADPYKHPLTALMEYASTSDPNGIDATTSSFKNVAGHNWFAAQWSPGKSSQVDFRVPKDFWNSNRQTFNYEGVNDIYIAYFYNKTLDTGTLKGMDNAPYYVQWFNPKTNTYKIEARITPVNGNLSIGSKPDGQDWVFNAKKN